MKVSLVSITNSCLAESSFTPEELIVYIARVSNAQNQSNVETSAKLIRYLIKNRHWSPFEMVDVTFEIITSRAIAQQILRHRSFSFQEFSQRYAKVEGIEPLQLRYQSAKNRQSSSTELNKWDAEWFAPLIEAHLKAGQALYNDMLAHDVAKECARFILPLTTQTKFYMKGSVRSWIHYLQVRCDEHAQLEHRQIAEEIKKLFNLEFPTIAEVMNDGHPE